MLRPLAAFLAPESHRNPVQAVSRPAALLHHIKQTPRVDKSHPSALAFDPQAEAMADEVTKASEVLASNSPEHGGNK